MKKYAVITETFEVRAGRGYWTQQDMMNFIYNSSNRDSKVEIFDTKDEAIKNFDIEKRCACASRSRSNCFELVLFDYVELEEVEIEDDDWMFSTGLESYVAPLLQDLKAIIVEDMSTNLELELNELENHILINSIQSSISTLKNYQNKIDLTPEEIDELVTDVLDYVKANY